jgi:hypothetical protein
MSIISKQIGWSQESNLLYEILKKLTSITSQIAGAKPYKVYSALITDNGDTTMTITELQNTIGPIVWTVSTTGEYRADLVGAFPLDKTWLSITANAIGAIQYNAVVDAAPDGVRFFTSSNQAQNTPIEIRVYK